MSIPMPKRVANYAGHAPPYERHILSLKPGHGNSYQRSLGAWTNESPYISEVPPAPSRNYLSDKSFPRSTSFQSYSEHRINDDFVKSKRKSALSLKELEQTASSDHQRSLSTISFNNTLSESQHNYTKFSLEEMADAYRKPCEPTTFKPNKKSNDSYMLSQPVGSSAYRIDFGGPGFDPRGNVEKFYPKKYCTNEDPLNFGSTRGTSHIPGYMGFLSETEKLNWTDQKSRALKFYTGQTLPLYRDVANIVDNYRGSFLPGYTGHVPKALSMEEGTRHCIDTCLTTYGRGHGRGKINL